MTENEDGIELPHENGNAVAIEPVDESHNDETADQSCIDTRLIPSKLSYFFMECYGGAFVPYLIVFLASTGLDMKEAGFITGIRLVSSVIAAPLWGYLADRTGKRKLIFVILCVGSTLSIFPMPWVARVFKIERSVEVVGTWSNKSYNRTVDESDMMKVGVSHVSFSSTLFYVLLSLVFISNVFTNPINGIIDSYVMNVVKSHPRKADYGKQRMYGAFGFGIANFLAGFLSDHFHPVSLSNYTAIFYVFLPSILLLIPSGYSLASQTRIEVTEEKKENKGKLLLRTFKNMDNIMFMLSTFIIGVINAIVIGYMFKLMEDQMSATKTHMGLANLVASIIEILVFPLTEKILHFCGGAIGGIEVALFSYFLRLIMIIYIENPWLVLPTQTLNCFSFALFWAAAIEYTQKIAQKEIYITMFSILNSVYFNVAGLIGYLGGGVIYSKYGGKTLFRISAYVSLAWVVVMVLYYQILGRLCKRLSKRKKWEVPSTFTIDTIADAS